VQVTVLIARAETPLSPSGDRYSEEALKRMADSHLGLFWDDEQKELRANVEVFGADARILRQALRWGIQPFVANSRYRGRRFTINDLSRHLQEQAASHNATNPFKDVFSTFIFAGGTSEDEKHDDSKGPSPHDELVNEEIHILFHKLWTQAVGTPGYIKADWKRLVDLLAAKGVRV
jgi:hypothetical protein